VVAVISNVNVTVSAVQRLHSSGVEADANYIEDGLLAVGLEWVGKGRETSHRLPSLWARQAMKGGEAGRKAVEKMWKREWAHISKCATPVTVIKMAWNANGNHWRDITMNSTTRTVSVYDPMGPVRPHQLDTAMGIVKGIVDLWSRALGIQGLWICRSNPGRHQATGDQENCGIHVILHEAQECGFSDELLVNLHKAPWVIRRWLARRTAQEVVLQKGDVLQPLAVDPRDLELAAHGIELIDPPLMNLERPKTPTSDLQDPRGSKGPSGKRQKSSARQPRLTARKEASPESRGKERPIPDPTQSLQGSSEFCVNSLNVGPRGFWQSQRTLQKILEQGVSTAILHLQDTRIRERQVKKMKRALQTLAPDFMAFHSCHAESTRRHRRYPVSVTTLVRRSLAADTCQHQLFMEEKPSPQDRKNRRLERLVKLDAEMWAREHGPEAESDSEGKLRPKGEECSGRMLAIRCSPPDAETACYHVNVYMPAGPDNATWQKISREILRVGRMAKQEGALMVVCGDFNANVAPEGRCGYSEAEAASKTIRRRDSLLSRLVKNSDLQVGAHLNSCGNRTHTWSGWEKSAILDYCLFSREAVFTSGKASKIKHDPVIDHKMISSTFPARQMGHVRPATKEGDGPGPPRVRWSKLAEQSQEFRRMTSREAFAAIEGDNCVSNIRKWGCWAAEKAAALCGMTKPTNEHRHFCLPGHKKLFRTMTLLGRWKRIELSRSNGPPDADTPTRRQLRAKYKRVSGLDIDLGELEEKDDAESQATVIRLLKEAMLSVRQKVRQDEKEASTISLERCRKAIRRSFNDGRIKYITGKREPTQSLWGMRTSGPIGVRLRGNRAERARAASVLLDSNIDMTWSRKGKIGRAAVVSETWMCVSALAGNFHFDIIKGDSILPTVFLDGSNKLECQRAHLAKEGTNSRRVCAECKGRDIWSVQGQEPDTMLCICCRMMTTTRVEPLPSSPLLNAIPRVQEGHNISLRRPIGLEEVKTLIARLPRGKAPGPDGVPFEVFQHCDESVLEMLGEALNAILAGREIPEEMKGGLVRFLIKKEPSYDMTNLRPIVLLETLYKMLSMLIHDRLRRFVEDHQLLSITQEGSRRGHSTLRQVQRLRWAIEAAERDKKEIYLIYLDWSNAFNSVNVDSMFQILEAYGIPDVDLLKSMYDGSWFVGDNSFGRTDPILLERGVKQGDVLSPLMFSLVIDVLLRNWRLQTKARPGLPEEFAFVDDLSAATRTARAASVLLHVVADFEEFSGMRVNIKKSGVSAYDFLRKRAIATTSIKLRGQTLPTIQPHEAYKYLGVMVQLNGAWTAEKQHVLRKLRNAVDMIRTTAMLETWQRVRLVEMCVRSVFRYSAGLIPWTANEMERLNATLIQGFKAAWNLPSSTEGTIFTWPKNRGGFGHSSLYLTWAQSLLSLRQQLMSQEREVKRAVMIDAERTRESMGGGDWSVACKVASHRTLPPTAGLHERLCCSLAQLGLGIDDGDESASVEEDDTDISLVAAVCEIRHSRRVNTTLHRAVKKLVEGGRPLVRHLLSQAGRWRRRDDIQPVQLSQREYDTLTDTLAKTGKWGSGQVAGLETAIRFAPTKVRETRGRYDPGKSWAMPRMTKGDATMLEAVVGFDEGHYLLRWKHMSRTNQSMGPWMAKNRVTVTVDESTHPSWSNYAGAPWELECESFSSKAGPHGRLTMRTITTNDNKDNTLGGTTAMGLTGDESVASALTIEQPGRCRVDRWIPAEALGEADIKYPALKIKERLASFWRSWDYHADDPRAVVEERIRHRSGPCGGTAETRAAVAPRPRYASHQPAAHLRALAGWEQVPINCSLVSVDMSAMDKLTEQINGCHVSSSSGTTRVEEKSGRILARVETPMFQAWRGQHAGADFIRALREAHDHHQQRDKSGLETLHWDFTTRLGQACGANVLCSGAPLERDPYFPNYVHVGETLEIWQSDRPDNKSNTAVVLLPGKSTASDSQGWMYANECRSAVVCLPKDNKSKMVGINMGFSPVAIIRSDSDCTLPVGGWQSGDKERTRSATTWEIWVRGLTGDQIQNVKAASSVTEGSIDRWSLLASANRFGRCYYRSQGGGAYHDFDGVSAFTDGSLARGSDGSMGYGVAFREGDGTDIWGPTSMKEAKVASSLLPEADAVTMAILAADPNRDLAIGTDSATVLFAVKAVARRDFSNSQAIRRHESHLGPLIQALTGRRRKTTFYKLDGHKGHNGNERADKLADKGRREVSHPTDGGQQGPLRLVWGKGAYRSSCDFLNCEKVLQDHDTMRIEKAAGLKETQAAVFLQEKGAGLRTLGGVVNSTRVNRVWVQGVTGTTPVNHHLAKFGAAKTTACPLIGCKEGDETVIHTQCWCPALKEARIAAHHSIFGRVATIISRAMTRQSRGWESFKEAELRSMDIPYDESRRRRRPDLTLVNRTERKIFFVEFSRTWDSSVEAIREAEKRKKAQYQRDARLINEQWPSWRARVVPLVIGVRGKTSEKSLISYLRRMRLPKATRARIQRAMARRAIAQMAKIMHVRRSALREGAGAER
jgi:ribonuclease HI